MVQNVPANNVFKQFTGNASQRDWPVVFGQTSVAFLEMKGELNLTIKDVRLSRVTGSMTTRKYTYTALDSLKKGTTANVYGVVKWSGNVSKTRGSDLKKIISIIDPSLSPGYKLMCLLFGKSSSLPRVAPGDIIRMHRLKIVEYNGALQGQVSPGFSWLVFTGVCKENDSSDDTSDGGGGADHSTDHYEPIESMSTLFSFTQNDKTQIRKLRKWISTNENYIEQPLTTGSATGSVTHTKFCDVRINQYFNFVGQVVGVGIVKDPECVLLRMWDTTKCTIPICTLNTDNCRIDANAKLLKKASDFIYDVAVFDDHMGKAKHIKSQDFVRLTNLHAMKHKGTSPDTAGYAEFCLHGGTTYNRGLAVLPHNDTQVVELLQLIDNQGPFTNFKDVKIGSHFNLVGQVVSLTYNRTKSHVVLKVWDTTQCPFPVEELLVSGGHTYADLELSSKAEGHMYDIKIQNENRQKAAKCNRADFIQLTNVFASQNAGKAVEFSLASNQVNHDFSGSITMLEDDSEEVELLKKSIQAFINKNTNLNRAKTMPTTPIPTRKQHKQSEQPKHKAQPEHSAQSKFKEHNKQDKHPERREQGREPHKQHELPSSSRRLSSDSQSSTGTQKGSLGSASVDNECAGEIDNSKSDVHVISESQVSSSSDRTSKDPDSQNIDDKSPVTVITQHHDVAVSKIGDVLLSDVPNKHRLEVKILGTYPPLACSGACVQVYCPKCHFVCLVPRKGAVTVDEYQPLWNSDDSSLGHQQWWRSQSCHYLRDSLGLYLCPSCSKNKKIKEMPYLGYQYMLSLLLADHTGFLIANLWKRHASEFFNDTSPEEYLTDRSSFRYVNNCIRSLCPVTLNLEEVDIQGALQNKDIPWAQFCVKSYKPDSAMDSDSDNDSGTKYQIFDTIFVNNDDD